MFKLDQQDPLAPSSALATLGSLRSGRYARVATTQGPRVSIKSVDPLVNEPIVLKIREYLITVFAGEQRAQENRKCGRTESVGE